MPEAGGFIYGGRVRVVREMDTSSFRTTDPPPQVGDIGEVVTINTINGEVSSVGVEFGTRSWVLNRDDVKIVENQEPIEDPQVVEVDDGWTYLWWGELRLVPGEKVLLPKADDPTRHWTGTVTRTDFIPPEDVVFKFILGIAP